MKTKQCKDSCPKCGSLNIKYESLIKPDNAANYYPGFCLHCGCKFKEYYNHGVGIVEWENENARS